MYWFSSLTRWVLCINANRIRVTERDRSVQKNDDRLLPPGVTGDKIKVALG